MRRTWSLPAVSVLVVLSCALAACSGGDEEESLAPVDGVVDAFGAPNGRLVTVQLPTGRLDVTLGDPTREMPMTTEYDAAPDGALAVLVGWRFDTSAAIVPTFGEGVAEPVPAITLVTGDEDFSLDALMLASQDEESRYEEGEPQIERSGSGYAVLPGTEGEIYGNLAIEVDFDGLTQTVTVDDARPDVGPAQPLYDRPADLAPRRLDCGDPELVGAAEADGDQCTLRVQRVPWWPGVGWSDEDELWRVVTAQAFVTGVTRAGERESVDPPASLGLTLSGSAPEREDTGASGTTGVFADEESAVRTEAVVTGTFGGEVVTWRVPVLD